MSEQPMTQEEFKKSLGSKCPACRSENVKVGPSEADVSIWVPSSCGDCGAEWNDIYQLVGYAELRIKEKA
jgi:transposase-like protein